METSSGETALRQCVARFLGMEQFDFSDDATSHHAVAAAMHELTAAIRQAERTGIGKKKVQEIILPAYELHGRSPFVQRLQTWPRGYPGDFETIEALCGGENRARPNTSAWFIERYALQTGCAQQHRNKLAWQSENILEVCLERAGAKILSIACGGSRDLRVVQKLLADRSAKIWLNDLDSGALDCSLRNLDRITPQLTRIPGDVFRSINQFKARAPFELILAGGLFDYLTDRQIVWLLPKLVGLLAPGGRFCFTNMAVGNPDRVWIEYLANWRLLERNEADIRRLIVESELIVKCDVQLMREPAGLAILAKLTRSFSDES
jgi:extracellular factor (EF) 3-hydroxypalmitic acid methyl ester biosynthesis protein